MKKKWFIVNISGLRENQDKWVPYTPIHPLINIILPFLWKKKNANLRIKWGRLAPHTSRKRKSWEGTICAHNIITRFSLSLKEKGKFYEITKKNLIAQILFRLFHQRNGKTFLFWQRKFVQLFSVSFFKLIEENGKQFY